METAARKNTGTVALAGVSELSDDAQKLVSADLRPRAYVELLIEKELFADAVRFLAHALPKREAVWWAWVCIRRVSPDPPPPIAAALQATEKWIAQPNEDNRRAAMAAAEIAQFSSAAGCAALAAFFSGGSLAPPNAPAVPPGEYLTAKAVAGAIQIAALAREPEKAPEKFRGFIAQGLEVTTRIKLWEQ